MHYFQAIHIEFTPIRFIIERAFRGLDEIQEFHIAASKIDPVPSIVDISQSLVSLNITKSNIVSIPATYFSNCRQLIDFSLTHSKLQSFPNMSDVKETLGLLSLSNNYIRHVDLIYGMLFFQLIYQYLDHNWIQQFALQMIKMPNLIHAILTSNLITELVHPKVLASNRTSGRREISCISLENKRKSLDLPRALLSGNVVSVFCFVLVCYQLVVCFFVASPVSDTILSDKKWAKFSFAELLYVRT